MGVKRRFFGGFFPGGDDLNGGGGSRRTRAWESSRNPAGFGVNQPGKGHSPEAGGCNSQSVSKRVKRVSPGKH